MGFGDSFGSFLGNIFGGAASAAPAAAATTAPSSAGFFDIGLKDILAPAALATATGVQSYNAQKISDQQFAAELQFKQEQLQLQRDQLAQQAAKIEGELAIAKQQLAQLGLKTAIDATVTGGKDYANTILGAGQLQVGGFRR